MALVDSSLHEELRHREDTLHLNPRKVRCSDIDTRGNQNLQPTAKPESSVEMSRASGGFLTG